MDTTVADILDLLDGDPWGVAPALPAPTDGDEIVELLAGNPWIHGAAQDAPTSN